MWGFLWGKLAYGPQLFATALTNESIADNLADPAYWNLYIALATEVLTVAIAQGITPEAFNGFESPRLPARHRPMSPLAPWTAWWPSIAGLPRPTAGARAGSGRPQAAHGGGRPTRPHRGHGQAGRDPNAPDGKGNRTDPRGSKRVNGRNRPANLDELKALIPSA